MPFIFRESGIIFGYSPIQQYPFQEFLAEDSEEFQFFLLKNQLTDATPQEFQTHLTTVSYSGNNFSVRSAGISMITMLIVDADLQGDISVNIITDDEIAVSLSFADAKFLLNAIKGYVVSVYANYSALLNAINSATTLSDLQAIDILAGWPSNSL